MFKRYITVTATVLFFAFLATPAYSTDYQSMTTEELSEIRGTLVNSTQAERDAFRSEWMNRVNGMTPEERTQYTGPGSGRGTGPRDGSGAGLGGSGGAKNGKGQSGNTGNGGNNSGNNGKGGNGGNGGNGGRGRQ